VKGGVRQPPVELACGCSPLDPRRRARSPALPPAPGSPAAAPAAAAQAPGRMESWGQGKSAAPGIEEHLAGGWPAAWQRPGRQKPPTSVTKADPRPHKTSGCRRWREWAERAAWGVVNTTPMIRLLQGTVAEQWGQQGQSLWPAGSAARAWATKGAAHPAPSGMACPRAAAAWCSTSTNRSRRRLATLFRAL